eukprot:scaffold24310_cov113-Isochrysis_galbana.AAC.2
MPTAPSAARTDAPEITLPPRSLSPNGGKAHTRQGAGAALGQRNILASALIKHQTVHQLPNDAAKYSTITVTDV